MLQSYHQLFKFNTLINKEVSLFSEYYNHAYHRAYVLVTQQNTHTFKSHFNKSYTKNSIKELIQAYLNNEIKLPKLEFDLNAENKKSLSSELQTSTRQLNFIRFQLKGNLSSLYELTLNHIENKNDTV